MAKFYVESFMTEKLGLNGNELVGYAFLYAMTKQGAEVYMGGYTELAVAMGVSVPTTYNVMKKLVDRGLVQFGDVRSGIRLKAVA